MSMINVEAHASHTYASGFERDDPCRRAPLAFSVEFTVRFHS